MLYQLSYFRNHFVFEAAKIGLFFHFAKTFAFFFTCNRFFMYFCAFLKDEYRIKGLKYIVITVLTLLFLGYALPIVSLKIPYIQRNVTSFVADELSKLLHTTVYIGHSEINWLNRVALKDVRIDDEKGDTLLEAGNLTIGFKFWPMFKKKWILTTVRLFGVSGHIKRDTPDSPTNIQFILDALVSDNSEKKDRPVELHIRSALIRRCNLTYSVLNQEKTQKRFDPYHIHIRNISGNLALHHFSQDSINTVINKLSFDEISGLKVNKLSMHLVSNRDSACIENLTVVLPHSLLSIPSIGINVSEMDSLPDFSQKAMITMQVDPSRIAPKDFEMFLPLFYNFSDIIELSAFLSGSPNDVSIDKLTLKSGNELSLTGNLEMKGLLNPQEELYLFGKVQNLHITTEGIRRLSNNFVANYINLPEPVMNMEELNFSGEISGFTDHLVAFGNLSSSIGSIQMDMLLGYEKDHTFFLKGDIASSELWINALFEAGNPYGKARFKAVVDLTKPFRKKPVGSINAEVNDFDYNGYNYQNIYLSGTFNENEYKGLVEIDDPNGQLEINGSLQYEQEKTVFDFMAKLRHLRPDQLNMTDKYKRPDISLNINANFSGSNPDDFKGYIALNDIAFHTETDSFAVDSLMIETLATELPYKHIKVSSEIINGEIKGAYSFSTLLNDIYTTTENYLPALINTVKNEEPKQRPENNFEFFFTIQNINAIAQTLKLPVSILAPSSIRGAYNNETNTILSHIDIPSLTFGRTTFKDLHIHLDNTEQSMNLQAQATQYNPHNTLNYINIVSSAQNDSISTTLQWSNNKPEKYEATIKASALFVEENDKKLRTEITVPATPIFLKDSLWDMEPSSITIANGKVYIDNVYITKMNQYLHIDGVVSDNPKDLLTVDLQDIEISYIFDIVNLPALEFGGQATGSIKALSLLESMMIEGRLEVQNFAFNQAVQGKLNLSSEWDSDREGILLLGSIYKNDTTWTDVNGYIFPVGENKGLSLYFDANEVNISFLHKYMKGFSSDISGLAFGNVHLYGSFSQISIEGVPYVKEGKLLINPLNTMYTLSDSIYMSPSDIQIKNATVLDKNGNTGAVSLNFTHQYFKDMRYNIDVKADKMLVYDVSERMNPWLYGQVFASGTANINGTEDFFNIDGNVRSDAGTSVGFNFMENSTAETYDFISFIGKPEDKIHLANTENDVANAANNNTSTNYQLDFRVNVTPEANIELIMDPVAGDRIRGNGSGNLQVRYGSLTDMQMFGNYLISGGIYNFSLQQVIRKRFNIRDGSNVTFQGDPMAANLDISAIYNLTANIQDLDESLIFETANPSIPVNCVLKLDGRLQNPAISFDIQLPNSKAELERQVRSFIDTEDMLTRQIIYLLVLNKFYTPDYSRNEYRSDEFSAVASSAISAQLSSILSSLTDKVQIGTNIRSRQDGIKDTEIEMLLSSQLLNNRLLFNGNFGYKDNYIQSNAFVGEFDLEYKLTRSGEISLKAYNHANDLYRYNAKSLTRQGVGVMFRKDYSSLSDIFFRKRKENDLIKTADPASTSQR